MVGQDTLLGAPTKIQWIFQKGNGSQSAVAVQSTAIEAKKCQVDTFTIEVFNGIRVSLGS